MFIKNKIIKAILIFVLSFQMALAQTSETINDNIESKKSELTFEEKTTHFFGQIVTNTRNLGELSLVIFLVAGTILIVSWIPYAGILMYRRARNETKFEDFHFVSLQQNYFKADKNYKDGQLSALKYSFLTKDTSIQSKSSKILGMHFEVGYFNFKDGINNSTSPIKYHSAYWLIGPTVIWGSAIRMKSGPFLKLDLSAGTSLKRDVNLILKCELSFNYKFSNHYTVLFGVGDSYFNGQKGEGVATKLSNININAFAGLGYQF